MDSNSLALFLVISSHTWLIKLADSVSIKKKKRAQGCMFCMNACLRLIFFEVSSPRC